MANTKDWLNNFVENNAWSLLVAIVGMAIFCSLIQAKVEAQDERICSIEQAQIIIVENQKDILRLQVNQANLATDVLEIKEDVKELLTR